MDDQERLEMFKAQQLELAQELARVRAQRDALWAEVVQLRADLAAERASSRERERQLDAGVFDMRNL